MKIEDLQKANQCMMNIKQMEENKKLVESGKVFLQSFKVSKNVLDAGITAMTAEIDLQMDEMYKRIEQL